MIIIAFELWNNSIVVVLHIGIPYVMAYLRFGYIWKEYLGHKQFYSRSTFAFRVIAPELRRMVHWLRYVPCGDFIIPLECSYSNLLTWLWPTRYEANIGCLGWQLRIVMV